MRLATFHCGNKKFDGQYTVLLCPWRPCLTLNLAFSDASISVFGYSRGILEIFNLFKDDGYLITWIWTCQVKASPTPVRPNNAVQ